MYYGNYDATYFISRFYVLTHILVHLRKLLIVVTFSPTAVLSMLMLTKPQGILSRSNGFFILNKQNYE